MAKSKPVPEDFKNWIQEQGPLALPKRPIGKAMAYTSNNWRSCSSCGRA